MLAYIQKSPIQKRQCRLKRVIDSVAFETAKTFFKHTKQY